jgi:lysyl-tRNA synthetase class 2
MSRIDEIKEARVEKIKLLEQAGMEAYPSFVKRDFSLKELQDNFKNLKEGTSIVGRVMAIRGQGAILFIILTDGTSEFQVVMKSDEIDEKLFELFGKTVDMGDFIGITGDPMVTKRGQESLLVKSWVMASKSLLPLPEKHAGLKDNEERFRKRYLDILMNEEIREMFKKKELFWESTRNFLKKEGFMEVETPTLEVTTGGAEAAPFKTHHNDYDIDVYLRISVGELWQKRLMAAGFPKTFEIGRVYRNEGSSPDHLQEFTNMEFYWAYANYEDGMKLTEALYKDIAEKTFGTTKFETRGFTLDLSDEWQKIDYRDEVERQTGIDILEATEDQMKSKLAELKVTYEGDNRERLMDTLWKYCRKGIAGPAFLVHHPKLVSPLSKSMKDNPELTERFQVILAGTEVGNGFSELNDPQDQRERFELQQQLIDKGDEEAMMPEWEFVEMLEHGMPPTCGFGFGERMFSILVDKPLRETTLFPLMKPKD